MQFNGKKFEALRYGKNKEIKESTCYFTPGMDDIIEEKDSIRDLGVIMSSDATFSSHVDAVCSKVRQKSGWIMRTFHTRSTWFLKFMWKCLVQGHVDYCSQLYFPATASDMQKIENLQQIYTKKIPEVKHLNYWQRLQHLKLLSQERRMERYRIIYVWKILEGISPNCGLEVTTSERRGREVKIPPIKGTKGKIQNLRENSFQIQGPRLFNCLPKSVRGISKVSIDDFKQHLDRFLEKLPDEPKVENYIPSACNIVTASPTNSVVDLARTVRTRRPG